MFVDTEKIGADGKSGLEIDLDEQEKISDIHNIIAIDGKFLILANKRRHRVGLYLLAVSMDDPTDVKMILNQETKLLIADTDMHMMQTRCNDKDLPLIVVSFKCIDINTYNVVVIDYHEGILYWHESQHLWEADITGFLLTSDYFLVLSALGMRIISISNEENTVITDVDG